MTTYDRKNPGARVGASGAEFPLLHSFFTPKRRGGKAPHRHIAFRRIADAAMARATRLVPAMLPHGRREGREWVALNPRRADRNLGSFRVRLDTGMWADFAVEGARGRDLISLLAYASATSMKDAALTLAGLLGLDPYEAAP